MTNLPADIFYNIYNSEVSDDEINKLLREKAIKEIKKDRFFKMLEKYGKEKKHEME